MVLVEEITDDDYSCGDKSGDGEPSSKEPVLKQGFLQKAHEPLYGPKGSPEGNVAPETHKAHLEHKMNEDINAGMNRGAADNNGLPRPSWYTKEWPKDCQYNSPGCTLDEMDTSTHLSEFHREMFHKNERWEKANMPDVESIGMSFMQLNDEDLAEFLQNLKKNEKVTELDLSFNKIKDKGVQALVAALANGMAPALSVLKIYKNEFGELGKTMLTQGLPVFRKKLKIQWDEPSWSKPVPNPCKMDEVKVDSGILDAGTKPTPNPSTMD